MTQRPAPAGICAELAALTSPVDRAAAVTVVARAKGTLPGNLADLRRAALLEARAAGVKVSDLARRVGLSPGRISQLTVSHD